jgi:hippurate hydrolase
MILVLSLLDRAESLDADLVGIRRAVHSQPELGFQERWTQSFLLQEVRRLSPGATCRAVAGTGLLVTLREGSPKILLRACMDGLPIQETSGMPFESTVPGVSHACGHDGQVAGLLGAIALLDQDLPNAGVFALFQPAEELDTGARAVLGDGVFEQIGPDVILGFHGHPGLDAGTMVVRPGPMMASITTIRCEITGRTGHGAEPHLAADPITAAASLILDWQVALARRVDPRQPVVLSVGRVSGGSTPNVIPGQAEIEGTLRSLDPAIESSLTRILGEVARSVELRTATTVSLDAELVVPAVVNDAGVAQVAAVAAAGLLGPEALVEAPPSLGGDDFAWYLRDIPGCYVFVGERVAEREPYGWHDAAYDLDERSLPIGSAVLAAMVHRIAKEGWE